MAYGAVKIRFGIVCDEVRREDNGKLLLIGVYSSSIIVQQLPAVLVLSLVLGVDNDKPAEAAMEFRVLLNEIQLRRGKGVLNVRSAGQNLIAIQSIPLEKIESEGLLDFQLRLRDRDWETVCSLPLALKK
jgi:hypothetical protein